MEQTCCAPNHDGWRCTYDGIVGWCCHAPEDECIDDCDGPGSPFGGSYCAFDPLLSHFRCSDQQCAG